MHFKFLLLVIVSSFFVPKVRGDESGDYYNVRHDADPRNQTSIICMNMKPQHSMDINQIMGLWHANEIIMHTQDVPGEFNYHPCVSIYLSDITEQFQSNRPGYNYHNQRRTVTEYNPLESQQQRQQQQRNQQQHDYYENQPSETRYIRLVWSEGENNLEYTFNYTEYSPGLWKNVGEQRGSLVTLHQYTQFTGSVQVVKAVNDHLVLTFCGRDLKNTIYTIVLSRTADGLSSGELKSIRSLLARRGLFADSIRKLCISGESSALKVSVATAALLLVLLPIMKRFQ